MHDNMGVSYDNKVNKSSGTTSIRGIDHYQRHNHHHQSGSSVLNEGRHPLNVSVIICTCNPEPERMRQLFKALFSQSMRPHEIIVVTERTPNRQYYPYIRFVVNSGKGLSGARNTGVAYATGEYIAFIDDDAIPETTWLRTMLANMLASELDVVGGPVIPDCVSYHTRQKLCGLPAHLWWLIGCTPVMWSRPIGCNMMFRRKIFDTYMFDSRLGKHDGGGGVGEETDLINRLIQDGYKVGITSDYGAAVLHHVPQHRLTGRYLLERAYMEGHSKALMIVGTAEYSMIKYIMRTPTVLGIAVLTVVGIGYIVGKLSNAR